MIRKQNYLDKKHTIIEKEESAMNDIEAIHESTKKWMESKMNYFKKLNSSNDEDGNSNGGSSSDDQPQAEFRYKRGYEPDMQFSSPEDDSPQFD